MQPNLHFSSIQFVKWQHRQVNLDSESAQAVQFSFA